MSKTKRKKVNKLSDLSIDEVSLVDRSANQHAKLVISKRDDGEEEEEIDKANPDASDLNTGNDDIEDDDEDEEKDVEKGYFSRLIKKMFDDDDGELTTDNDNAGTLPDMSDVDKAFDPRMGMFGGQQAPPAPAQQPPFQQAAPAPGPQNAMPQGAQGFPAGPQAMPGQMQAGPPLPDEVIQYIQALEQALADAKGQGQTPSDNQEDKDVDTTFGKNLEDASAEELTFLQELSKNLEDEDTREAINKALESVSKLQERAEAAEEIAKSEREHRLNQEWIAKARSYANLPVSADEFGPVLKKLDEALDEDEMGLVTKVLSTANETVADLRVFDEIGKRGENVEVISKLDAKAEEIRKSDDGLSMEQARERALEADPKLYDEYIQESGR